MNINYNNFQRNGGSNNNSTAPAFSGVKKSYLGHLSKSAQRELEAQMPDIKEFAQKLTQYQFRINPPIIEGSKKNFVELSVRKSGIKGFLASIFKLPPVYKNFNLTEGRKVTDGLGLIVVQHNKKELDLAKKVKF